MEQTRIEISWGSLWRVFAMALFVVTLYYIRDVLAIVFIAVIISSALHTPVKYLESKKIPRVLSVLMIFLVVAGIGALMLYAVVPVILLQLKYFLANINTIQLPFFENFGTSTMLQNLDTSIGEWVSQLFYGGSNLINFFSSLIGNVLFFFVSLVLSFYLAVSKGSIQRFIRSMMPTDKEEYAIDLYKRMRRKIGRWFTSQIILSFFIGALTFIGLMVIGVDYALILAILAALLEIIPYVGPIAVGVISFIVILPQSASLAFIALIIFFVIQQLENHVLVPLIVGKAIGVDPVMVVIAILAGSQINGLIGAVLAVPAAIIVQEMVDDWSAKKNARRAALADKTL